MYEEQSQLEQAGCCRIDEAAEPTAKAMSALCGMMTRDDGRRMAARASAES